MFFYYFKNADYLKHEKEKDKNMKILIYGCLGYIITHFFISIFKSLTIYFWLILSLDILVNYLNYNQTENKKVLMKDNYEIKNYNSDDELEDIMETIPL